MSIIEQLTREIVAFRDARDWAQFHTPRNLAASISIEAGELLECFQWTEPACNRAAVEKEIADVAIYLLILCHETGVDLPDAIRRKLAINGVKYPVDKAKGKATKYDKL